MTKFPAVHTALKADHPDYVISAPLTFVWSPVDGLDVKHVLGFLLIPNRGVVFTNPFSAALNLPQGLTPQVAVE